MEAENRSSSCDLKYLGFFRVAVIRLLVCASNLYDYAKQNSGPLRSTVGTVEGAVTAVIGPVYEKFKGVPDNLLVFFDKKVDEAAHKLNTNTPLKAKKIAYQANNLIHKASQKATELSHEAKTNGPRKAFTIAVSASKELFVTQTLRVLLKLNDYPTLHNVSEIAVSTAAHWSKKYNHSVVELSQKKGYTVFSYLPLVPVEDIAKAFKQCGVEKKVEEDRKSVSSSDSD